MTGRWTVVGVWTEVAPEPTFGAAVGVVCVAGTVDLVAGRRAVVGAWSAGAAVVGAAAPGSADWLSALAVELAAASWVFTAATARA